MNKKLMAVAVAGAFITPALVFAQTATVQVYGRATVEYGYADQGTGKPNTDTFQTPGGSAVGFKGQEQLGGGMSAWFQCESSADVRGLNQDGFCGRNSAIGLKGGWGNLFFGRWDTPFKRATLGMVGAGDTGLLGAAFTMVGNSTGTAASGGQGGSVSLARNVWKRRESSMIYYESPSFSGFQVLAGFSAANATAVTDGTTNSKPRVGSIAGMYSNGPSQHCCRLRKALEFRQRHYRRSGRRCHDRPRDIYRYAHHRERRDCADHYLHCAHGGCRSHGGQRLRRPRLDDRRQLQLHGQPAGWYSVHRHAV
jgi:predicted porin